MGREFNGQTSLTLQTDSFPSKSILNVGKSFPKNLASRKKLATPPTLLGGSARVGWVSGLAAFGRGGGPARPDEVSGVIFWFA